MSNKRSDIFSAVYLKNVSFMLFAYWAVLVVWQNVGYAQTRGAVDLIVKIVLLGCFVSFFLFNTKTINKNLIYVLLFSVALLITLFSEPKITSDVIISYVFPIIFLLMIYCFGNNHQINMRQLICFCDSVIIVVLYSAVYALIFCRDQFMSAFSINNAYGNELSSFFVSSHEYGMYLVYAITACIFCLVFKKNEKFIKKLPYIVCIAVFVPNLILTFSRTAMLGAALIIVVYILFSKNRKLVIGFISLVCIAVIAVVFSPMLQDFIFKILLKGNNLAGRDELFDLAIRYYNDGTLTDKLFGRGIITSRDFFEVATDHGSVHNAYLQVLIYYGAVGLICMIAFLFVQFIACIKEIKRDRFIGVMSLGMLSAAMAMMFTNTAMIFNSPIDSYFLTLFAVVIPKYVRNALYSDMFYESKQIKA